MKTIEQIDKKIDYYEKEIKFVLDQMEVLYKAEDMDSYKLQETELKRLTALNKQLNWVKK